jgi:hypothetical protein
VRILESLKQQFDTLFAPPVSIHAEMAKRSRRDGGRFDA